MRTLWEKIKALFSRMWNGLTKAGRVIVGLILAGIIAGAVYAGVNTGDNDSSKEERAPEITQVYEPSIGTPLPPDNASGQPGEQGAVSGAITTEPSTPEDKSAQDMMTTNYVAPNSGIDPSQPVSYENASLKFAATLPAGSNVAEESSRITFTSQSGDLHYVVSVNHSADTLAEIEAQLRNSPSASNISATTFTGQKALQFSAQGYGTGIVFASNGKIYYLLGDKIYFAQFKTI